MKQRFEVVVPLLVAVLVREPDERRRGQLVEGFIGRLEIGWRESGVGDIGVGKRVKAMAGALNGRIQRYGALLVAQDATGLQVALAEHQVVGAERFVAALIEPRKSLKSTKKAVA